MPIPSTAGGWTLDNGGNPLNILTFAVASEVFLTVAVSNLGGEKLRRSVRVVRAQPVFTRLELARW